MESILQYDIVWLITIVYEPEYPAHGGPLHTYILEILNAPFWCNVRNLIFASFAAYPPVYIHSKGEHRYYAPRECVQYVQNICVAYAIKLFDSFQKM